MAILAVSGISWKLLDKYIETSSAMSLKLIREHIDESNQTLKEVNQTLKRVEINQRVVLYRLDRLDKTPEYPNDWRRPKPEHLK